MNFCLLPPSQSTNAKDVQAELEKSKNPRLEALARVGQNITNYEGRWTQQDEVFLIAAVVNRFLKTGSLASPRGSADQACWRSIHENFEWLQLQAYKMGGQKPRPKRTVTALLRRFKLIKEHQTTKKSIRALYHDWKSFYCTDGTELPSAPPHSPAHGSTVQQIVTIPACSKLAPSAAQTDEDDTTAAQGSDASNKATKPFIRPLIPGEAAATLRSLGLPSSMIDDKLPDGETAKLKQEVNEAKGTKEGKKVEIVKEDTGRVSEDGITLDMRLVNKLNAVVDNRPTPKARVRIKWTTWDVSCLWNGIQLFGNSWSEIRKNFLPLRTTDQVKDKGKRLLRRVGWKTGRTKKFFYKASEEAKEIARITCSKRSIPKISSYNDRSALSKVSCSGLEPMQEVPDCDNGMDAAQYNALAEEVAEALERKARINETKATLECVIQEVIMRSRQLGAGPYARSQSELTSPPTPPQKPISNDDKPLESLPPVDTSKSGNKAEVDAVAA